MAYRKGFTDRQYEDGDLYETTVLDGEQPIEAILSAWEYEEEVGG